MKLIDVDTVVDVEYLTEEERPILGCVTVYGRCETCYIYDSYKVMFREETRELPPLDTTWEGCEYICDFCFEHFYI